MKRRKRRTTIPVRRRKGIVTRFFEFLSHLVLIPFVIVTILNVGKVHDVFARTVDAFMSAKTTIVINNDDQPVVTETEESPKTEIAEVSPQVEEKPVTEDEQVEEPVATETEDTEATKKNVVVNGSSIWAAYVQTKPQREAQAVIKRIAKEHDVDWKMAYAICLKESRCNIHLDCLNQYGRCDNGQSFGPWQIYRPQAKGITISQAEDFEWATSWSVARLKRHESLGHYEQIRSHNGLYGDNRNAGYVEDVERLMSIL